MSRKFKKHYTAFVREILKEFMSENELEELDKKYTEAKKARMILRIENQVKGLK
jgi:hypothetical protein